jgi:hypothetical protein
MERAAKVLKDSKPARRIIGDEDVARGLWPTAVGKVITRHTGKITLVRSTLVIQVEDAVWQKQLHSLSGQIIDRMQKLMGSTAITALEFRIGVPKRQPQRAESTSGSAAATGAPVDEADEIQDPVLKKVYQISRKRATA